MVQDTVSNQLKAYLVLWDCTQDLGVALSILGKGLLKAKTTSWSLSQQLQGEVWTSKKLNRS